MRWRQPSASRVAGVYRCGGRRRRRGWPLDAAAAPTPSSTRAGDADRVPVRVERSEQFVEAGARQRADDDDARRPGAGAGAPAQRQHLAHLARRLLGQRRVALVDDQDVGDLQDAGLDRLHFVAESGRADDDVRVGDATDVNLGLPDADRLDDDDIEAGGVEHVDPFPRSCATARPDARATTANG